MARIRPISDLRNKANEISRLCHTTGEPVFITKNGREDLVVLSAAAYARERDRLELYRLLDEAEADEAAGHNGSTVADARRSVLRRSRK